MKSFDIVALIHADGFLVCLPCTIGSEWNDCEVNPDTLWSPVFVASEWDTYPSCDRCYEAIDSVTLIDSEPTIESALVHYICLSRTGFDRHNGLGAILQGMTMEQLLDASKVIAAKLRDGGD